MSKDEFIVKYRLLIDLLAELDIKMCHDCEGRIAKYLSGIICKYKDKTLTGNDA